MGKIYSVLLKGLVGLCTLWLAVNTQTMDQMITSSLASSDDAVMFPNKDTVRVELDMLFTAKDYETMYTIDSADNSTTRVKRKAIRFDYKRWTDNQIPYVTANSGFSSTQMAEVMAAIDDWNKYTCLNWRPLRSGDDNFVRFKSGGGCSSYVGMSGGEQPINLAPGCRHKGIVMHEMGHALGFHHEQTRPDRDQWVRILEQNISPSMRFNFDKHSRDILDDHGVPYDYTSIMHYGKTAFTRNGEITIQTLDPAMTDVIGARQSLSFRDIKLANLIYKCADNCPKKTCPGEGFVGKNCKCHCPGAPLKDCTSTTGGTGDKGGGGNKGGNKGGTGGNKGGNGGNKGGTGGNKGGTGGNKGGTGGNKGGGGNSCSDSHRHCQSWASRGECTRNSGWMLTNCKKSCNKCSTGTKSRCGDSHPNCASWASRGECQRNPGWMHSNCMKSCNKCNNGGSRTNCVNHNTNCAYWTRQGYCRHAAFRLFMKDKCPASCGYCSSSQNSPNQNPAPAPKPVCRDMHAYCAYWASTGRCYSHYMYMRTNCQKSCRVCS